MKNPFYNYILITLNYWGFTITDGALRMLVVLYFYDLGYKPLEIAVLFLFAKASAFFSLSWGNTVMYTVACFRKESM